MAETLLRVDDLILEQGLHVYGGLLVTLVGHFVASLIELTACSAAVHAASKAW